MSAIGIDVSPASALIARAQGDDLDRIEARDMRQAWKAAQNIAVYPPVSC